jgi:hypothetical protein
MNLNNTSQRRTVIPALAVVAASYLGGVIPVKAEISSSYRPVIKLPSAYKGTSAWGARMQESTDLYVYADNGTFANTFTRETTEQEYLIANLRAWEHLGPNWDGEGAHAPKLSSLRSASNFVCLLSQSAISPEPLLHASGRAGLSWDDENGYGELEFLNDKQAAYFFTKGDDKHKGVISLDGSSIPPVIAALIPHAI